MGTVIASREEGGKDAAAMFYFARAATYEAKDALNPSGRQAGADLRAEAVQKLPRQRRRF